MFEKLTKKKKLEQAKDQFVDAVNRDSAWQRDARGDFEFYTGEGQWSSDEKAILEEELRPVLTFNLTKSQVDLVIGMSEENKTIPRATPVDPSDGFLAEVLNDAIDWIRDTEDFDAEESAALESATICGRGYVAVDFVPDPKRFGEIIMKEIVVPVSEVHVDPSARRPGWDDAAAVYWDRWLTKEDFKMKFPKVSNLKVEQMANEVDTFGTVMLSGDSVQSAFEPEVDFESDDSDYDDPLDMRFFDRTNNQIRVVHMEYWETFKRYFIYREETGKFEEVPQDLKLSDVKKQYLQEYGQPATVESLTDKRVRWFIFTGKEILYDDVSPLPYPGFSIMPLMAFRDVSQRTANHFGLVRLIRDPQKEINKRWSQALNLLNQQVQPGVFAETEAFVNEKQAEQSMRTAGAITYINPGAISAGRIKERTVPNFPNAPMQMEQFSQDILKKITGINPDLLGQDRGRQEPGVVVRLRQQQGVMLLKPLFRNFNNMKKALFKRHLAIVMAYMPDEQILRILGQTDRYVIDKNGIITDKLTQNQANIRDVRNLEYNIIGEEAPGNMTKRMLELSAFLEMQQQGLPVPPDMIIEKMDIAETDKTKWLQYIENQMKQQEQQQQEMMAAQMAVKQKELSLDEQRIVNDFLLGIAKLKQMTQKDAIKMKQTLMQLSIDQQRDFLNYIVDLAGVEKDHLQIESSEQQSKIKSGVDLMKEMMKSATALNKPQSGEKSSNEKT